MAKKIALIFTVLIIVGSFLFLSKLGFDSYTSSKQGQADVDALTGAESKDESKGDAKENPVFSANPKDFRVSNMNALEEFIDVVSTTSMEIFHELKSIIYPDYPDGIEVSIVPSSIKLNGDYISFDVLNNEGNKSLGKFEFKYKESLIENYDKILITITNLYSLESRMPVGDFNASAMYAKIKEALINDFKKNIVCRIDESSISVTKGAVAFDVVEESTLEKLKSFKISF